MLVLESDGPYLLFADDADRAVDFWRHALRLTTKHRSVSGGIAQRVELVDCDGHSQLIVRHASSKAPTSSPTRIRLAARDTRDVVAAVERLDALGASRSRPTDPSQPDHAEVIDPGGNTVTVTAIARTRRLIRCSRPSRGCRRDGRPRAASSSLQRPARDQFQRRRSDLERRLL